MKEKSKLLLVTHRETLVNWLVTPSGRRHFFHHYFEDQLLSGSRSTSTTLLRGIMSEQSSFLDFHTDETNSGTEWKWNNVSEEMARKFGTSYIPSNELLAKAGPMTWKKSNLPKKCGLRRPTTTKILRLLHERTSTQILKRKSKRIPDEKS